MSLARQEGFCLFSAAEAMLKGVLESDEPLELIAGPRTESFSPLFELARDQAVASQLRGHGTTLIATPDAGRAVTLAAHVATSGRRALALVPNGELDATMPAIGRVGRSPSGGGTVALLLEDDPARSPASCPRRAAIRLRLPCLEPSDVEQLRDAMEHVMRLGRAERGPVAIVVHRWVLRSAQTLAARPNRVVDPVHVVPVPAPRRRPRWAESGGVLRVARRLELNRAVSLPSPGERVPVGFLVVGPAAAAMAHLTYASGLHGRVPVLQLGLVHPIDDSALQRMLGRCEQVVVIEPRPGSMEASVLAVAEAARQRGEAVATVWGRRLPGDAGGPERVVDVEEALHPSGLARRIVDLLHMIRPGVDLEGLLAPDPPEMAVRPPPRGEDLGTAGALAEVRRVLGDVDQRLRDRAPRDEDSADDAESTALAIDGVEPAGGARRIVRVETWPYRRFLAEGIASLRQAAWDDRPWMFLICAVGADDPHDVERLVRGAVPGERADDVRIEVADLNDRAPLCDLLAALAGADGLSAVVIRDGPPPRYDVAGLERERAEIDRLGYEPRQRMIRSAEEACAIRAPVESPQPPSSHEPGPSLLRTHFSVGRVGRSRRTGPPVRLRVRPLFEQVEVVRDRPPASTWRDASAARLTLPSPLHGRQSQWRVHLAGFRGPAPGVAASALCEAGQSMGYRVCFLYDPTPIGPGRRAWAQVLFTRPRRDQSSVPLAANIPYGEADLLLGLEPREALRGVEAEGGLRVASPQHTCAVLNLGPFRDELRETGLELEQEAGALRSVTREDRRLFEDFAGACRSAFHTDRVVDLALVGAAFQRGMIPVSLEAIEKALGHLESEGLGRAREAFQFGCHLSVDARLFGRPRDTRADDVPRMIRRTRLLLRRGRAAGRLDMARFGQLLERSLAEMPGLAETDPGRAARRDFVIGLHRCLAWGGLDYAWQYADLVTALYRSDRGDKGRAITRDLILPLAEAMLIRDPVYIATMVTSPNELRRTRQQLNVKLARGDRLERRYLTRIELVAFARRFRLDVRSSDWPAWIAALGRQRILRRWRGTVLERQIRDYIIGLARRAIRGAAHDYRRWSETMQRLHHQARVDRLRGMAISELRMLVEPEEER